MPPFKRSFRQGSKTYAEEAVVCFVATLSGGLLDNGRFFASVGGNLANSGADTDSTVELMEYSEQAIPPHRRGVLASSLRFATLRFLSRPALRSPATIVRFNLLNPPRSASTRDLFR